MRTPRLYRALGKDGEGNEPEPDLTVLRAGLHELGRKPQPEDILLVVEVGASTLDLDLSTRAGARPQQ